VGAAGYRREMRTLLDIPQVQARKMLRLGAPAYLCVNPVEYHGPHLSLHNDRLVSAGLARDLHARVRRARPDWDFVLAGDLELGVDPVPGPGSRHSSYRTVRDSTWEAARALVELGARRIVIVTFHGAPLHNLALDAVVRWLDQLGVAAVAPFADVMRSQLDLDASRFKAAAAHLSPSGQDQVLGDLKLDFHAGFFETSVALHYAPESVDPTWRELPPCPPIPQDAAFLWAADRADSLGMPVFAAELRFAAAGRGWAAMRPFRGYTGHPAMAAASAGKVFADAIIDLWEPIVMPVLLREKSAERPPFRWVLPATLWGMLPTGGHPALEEVWTPRIG
jgi:creatinine amidohydrolase